MWEAAYPALRFAVRARAPASGWQRAVPESRCSCIQHGAWLGILQAGTCADVDASARLVGAGAVVSDTAPECDAFPIKADVEEPAVRAAHATLHLPFLQDAT